MTPHDPSNRTTQNELGHRVPLRWKAAAVVLAFLVAAYLSSILLLPEDAPKWVRDAVLGAMALGLLAAVYFLGWTRTVFVKPDRVAWPWGIPVALFALATFACLGVSTEAMVSLGAAVLVGTVLYNLAVGLVEDLMFRGVLLSGLRGSRVPEWAVLAITSVAFGLLHLVNIVAGATLDSTLIQVFTASLIGATFYLALRVTGTLLVPILLHGLWDLAVHLDVSAVPVAETLKVIGFLIGILGAFVAIALVIVEARRARRSRVAAGGPVVAN